MQSLGFVFPGQGSQSVGMLKDISESFPEIQTTFAEASHVLNYDLWELVAHGPTEELDKTVHTQPALLTASYAIWHVLKKKQTFQPILLAGHSLGEYTALVCADAIAFTDAVKLVAARGQYMQEAMPAGEGALAAILGLEDECIHEICVQSKLETEVLSSANFNSPGQVVIAGHKAAVERALILAKEKGAKLVKILPVSVPSHCILMKPAAEKLLILLEKITLHEPAIPVLNNVDVQVYTTPASIRDGLVRQLYMPVQWVKTIRAFNKAGVTKIIECGPGRILSQLSKRIINEIQLANTADIVSLENLITKE